MTDIVQALRQGSLSKDDYRWEAADEIERLRAALEAADKLRNGIRAAGVKRMPELYEAVMAFDAARAGRPWR
jgi:hypothetical protein